MPLWQVQVAGMARNMFSYSIIVTAREALPSHPSPDVNSLADLEKVLRVRLQTGAPGPSGQVDPDGVGILPWQTCVYAAGETPVEALKFIHFILSHKVHHGILPTMPELSVDVIGGNLRNLPEPWVLNETAVVDPAPKPFSVVPARGKRHVLAQLEQKAIEGEGSQAQEEEQDDEEQQGGSCYVFSVFGGIYPFRARFDENSIAGAHVKLGADGDGGREYLRYVEFRGLDEGRDKLKVVLENCLAGLPVYLVSMVNQSDPVVQWLLQQGTVCLGEATA